MQPMLFGATQREDDLIPAPKELAGGIRIYPDPEPEAR
jgi:hypothetical protein